MDPRLAPLAAMLELNADLLLNCLDGLAEEEARWRPPPAGNSMAFLAAHLTESRHYLATLLGRPTPNPLSAALAGARGIDDVKAMPSLAELRQAWAAIGQHLRQVLPGLSAAQLDSRIPQRFPGTDGSTLGAIAFLVQHDSYHLGQAAFLRRQLGREAMSYARRPAVSTPA